jgi:hypothetical protein
MACTSVQTGLADNSAIERSGESKAVVPFSGFQVATTVSRQHAKAIQLLSSRTKVISRPNVSVLPSSLDRLILVHAYEVS